MMKIKFVSWNVKHFSGRSSARLRRVVEYLTAVDADVISLYEVKGSAVFSLLHELLPGYVWANTHGRQSQEILVGVRASLGSIGFEQTDSFKAGNNFLRPGLLTTIKSPMGPAIVFLSLHLKSGGDFLSNAVREEQFNALRGLNKALRKISLPLVAMGDLNTMGLTLSYGAGHGTDVEFKLMDRKMRNAGLCKVPKDWDHTWTPGLKSRYDPADLDHVYASKGVLFTAVSDDRPAANIKVDWPKGYSPRAERSEWWRDEMSDHAPLIGTVIL